MSAEAVASVPVARQHPTAASDSQKSRPSPLSVAAGGYTRDLFERWVLFWDRLRQRADKPQLLELGQR